MFQARRQKYAEVILEQHVPSKMMAFSSSSLTKNKRYHIQKNFTIKGGLTDGLAAMSRSSWFLDYAESGEIFTIKNQNKGDSHMYKYRYEKVKPKPTFILLHGTGGMKKIYCLLPQR